MEFRKDGSWIGLVILRESQCGRRRPSRFMTHESRKFLSKFKTLKKKLKKEKEKTKLKSKVVILVHSIDGFIIFVEILLERQTNHASMHCIYLNKVSLSFPSFSFSIFAFAWMLIHLLLYIYNEFFFLNTIKSKHDLNL